MKRDHYFPHEINLRNDKEVIKLIECEGASGYGIYWALMEYLRTQDEYLGNMLAMKTIARQMRTKPHKVETVLKNYGLFIITGDTFRSAKMESVMKALADIDYKGDLNYEASGFIKDIPTELRPVGLEYMAKIGHYLVGRFEYYKNNGPVTANG